MGRKLSIGGRVTLMDVVLNNMSTNFFSFFKAPKEMIKEIIKLQRNFL